MRILRKLGILFLLVFGPALAETYTGVLIDAACTARDNKAPCTPTWSTTSFALLIAARSKPQALKLDAAGNLKAAAALKHGDNGADRAVDPDHPPSGSVIATVIGMLKGDELIVNSIQLD